VLAKRRLEEFQEFVKGYLKDGEDYGKIPGVAKPSLFKPGAEKLCELYGLVDTYPEEKARRIENWDTGLFFYEFTCVLTKKGTSVVIGEGKGSCSTYESRYRYRDAARKCPNCGKEAIIKGKEEYGGGWLCWQKKGGCGGKWADGDQAIEGQEIGKVENANLHDVINTVLKMAKKRAKIDAVIAATRSSGIFTQDVEDAGADTAPREDQKQEPVLIGVVSDTRENKGDFWLRVGDSAAVVPKSRKDLKDKLKDCSGKQVELLGDYVKGNGSNKTCFMIRAVVGISEPEPEPQFEATDEDIPF
jgi:hypothetical protein